MHWFQFCFLCLQLYYTWSNINDYLQRNIEFKRKKIAINFMLQNTALSLHIFNIKPDNRGNRKKNYTEKIHIKINHNSASLSDMEQVSFVFCLLLLFSEIT